MFLGTYARSDGWRALLANYLGAGGIENNTGRNFKDLEETLGNAKALKRNNRECKGILIGPSKAPRFSRSQSFLHQMVSFTVTNAASASGSNIAARMASRQQLEFKTGNLGWSTR
jgi:hypothetical protein